MAEDFLNSAMVPGLVTIKDKDGKTQNVFPIDARELIRSGDYELVDNGAIQAARMNANPLRSGRSNATADQTIAEVTGIEGRVMASSDESVVSEARAAGDNADAVPATGPAPAEQDAAQAKKSAEQPKTDAEKKAATGGTSGGTATKQ